MNAKEARKKAEQLVTTENRSTISKVEKVIEVAVNKGYMSCNYYSTINEVVQDYFKREGFSVNYRDEGRNEFSYEIKW